MLNKLDGIMFSEMVISGANKLSNNRQMVNDLNVFPVPDGDTGTNMSLTAASVVEALRNKREESVGKAAEIMAYSTLRGARGNSGVILSQLFRGFSKSVKGRDEINANEFVNAVKSASEAAYKAVMEPTEGTILTVSRMIAEGALSCDSEDINEALEAAVSAGEDALKKTTEMLPALKSAGVVDAGGQGLMLIFEGALEYLKTGKIVENEEPLTPVPDNSQNASAVSKTVTDIKFQYCTEFIVEKRGKADTEAFRAVIQPQGDCMLVIDDDDVVKVHIHTNHPGSIIEEALKMGEIITLKVDNMKRQHGNLVSQGTAGTAKKSKNPKSTEPKPKKAEPLKKYGFAAVCSGKGISGILTDLGVDRVIEGGQSMNPSAQDIIKAVSKVRAETVYVFPNNKNIIMAAEQAAEILSSSDNLEANAPKNIIVIPTRTVPQCIRAMVEFNVQKTAEENKSRFMRSMKEVKTGQITYAARDTEISGNSVKKGDILGLCEDKVRYIGTDIFRVLEKIADNYVDDDTEYLTVYYGKDIKKQDAAKMEEKLSQKYEDVEVSFKRGGQPLYYCIVAVE